MTTPGHAAVPEPTFGRTLFGTSAGRKLEATEIDAALPPPSEPRRTDTTTDLTVDREVIEVGRSVDPALGETTVRAGQGPRRRLSPSELEARLARYREFRDKLTPEERRIVDEFQRLLRDVR